MSIFRVLNEFICEPVVFALEPARSCISKCTYCFSTLNSQIQKNSRSKSLEDDGSFERTLTKAYSPSYDPTDILQWSLRERLAIGFANTVEPLQDLKQGVNLLRMLDQFNIPIFFQTKGVNHVEARDHLKPFHDNSTAFCSISSLDDRIVKRFEPGTPKTADRLHMMEWFADNGFWVIGAISPYCEEWCSDPAALVQQLADSGCNQIFFDRLHLNHRQFDVARDRVMAEMAGGRLKVWPEKATDHLAILHETAMANDLEWFATGFEGLVYGHGNTIPSINPVECFSRGRAWPYYDGFVFNILENNFYSDLVTVGNTDPRDSIILHWSDALAMMESQGVIDQPFAYSSLRDVIHIYKHIPDSWKNSIPDPSPIRNYYRALWNSPRSNQFIWRHPYIKAAANMDGTPMLDADGNLIAVYHAEYFGDTCKKWFRRVENLDDFTRITRET